MICDLYSDNFNNLACACLENDHVTTKTYSPGDLTVLLLHVITVIQNLLAAKKEDKQNANMFTTFEIIWSSDYSDSCMTDDYLNVLGQSYLSLLS